MRRGPLWTVGLLALGAGASYALPAHLLFAYGQFLAYLAAAAGLTVLVGGAGQLFLGQAAPMAAGAYAMALTQNALYDAGFTVPARVSGSGRFAAAARPDAAAWTLPVALLAGVLAAAGVGALLGLATARLRGPYLAGLTLAVGLAVAPVTALVGALGGEQGLTVSVPRIPDALAAGVGEARWRAWVALAGVALVLLLLGRLTRGRAGRDLRAARDDEVAAVLAGVPVARVRLLAVVAGAGAAGLAGGLYVYLTGTVLPGYFGLTLSLFLVFAVIVGGPGSLGGAAVGTLFVVGVPVAVSDILDAVHAGPALTARLAGNAPLALLGLAMVVVSLVAPGGVAALARRWWSRGPLPRPNARGAGPGRWRPYVTYENEQSTRREDGVRTP